MINYKAFPLRLVVVAAAFSLAVACSKQEVLLQQEGQSFNGSMGPEITGAAVTANFSPFYWSGLMIANVSPVNNIYSNNNSTDSLSWSGVNGGTGYFCRTDCSGLITALYRQTYGYSSSYFKSWTGYNNPYASTYYNEIVAQDHFTRISKVGSIQQGDLIAIKYPAGSSNTGHTMLVAAGPQLRSATKPLISNTRQFEVWVMDCSSSGHGPLDTRYIDGSSWNDGIGKGVFRVYVNANESIVGYTWSTYSNSTYYKQSDRPLAVGRLIP